MGRPDRHPHPAGPVRRHRLRGLRRLPHRLRAQPARLPAHRVQPRRRDGLLGPGLRGRRRPGRHRRVRLRVAGDQRGRLDLRTLPGAQQPGGRRLRLAERRAPPHRHPVRGLPQRRLGHRARRLPERLRLHRLRPVRQRRRRHRGARAGPRPGHRPRRAAHRRRRAVRLRGDHAQAPTRRGAGHPESQPADRLPQGRGGVPGHRRREARRHRGAGLRVRRPGGQRAVARPGVARADPHPVPPGRADADRRAQQGRGRRGRGQGVAGGRWNAVTAPAEAPVPPRPVALPALAFTDSAPRTGRVTAG